MANQFSVQPASVMPGLSAAMAGIRSGAESKRETVSEQAKQAKLKEASTLMNEGKLDELSTLMVENTWIRDNIDKTMNWKNEQTKQNAIESAKDILIKGVPPAQALNERAKFVAGQGGDASGTIQLAQEAQQDPQTAITEAEKVLALYDQDAMRAYLELKGGGVAKQKSSPATDLDDFTRDAIEQYSLDNDGAMMPPGERNLARKEFKRAQAQEVRETSRAVEGVKTSSKYAQKFFEKANDVNTALYNIDDAIEALKSGAITGPAARKLPSVRNATLKLENAQNRMGLDVVKDVTFGALSEKELDVAKQTAMPTGLQPDEMVNWLVEKRRISQIQLEWVQKAADHFAEGGSLVDWIRQNRANPSTRRLPEGVTEDDISATMQANRMTREQVLARLSGGQ